MITTGKKRYSRLLAGNRHFFFCGGKFSLRPEKKDTLRPEKKKIQSSVCWVCGSGNYDRKKKDTVVCLVGARSLLRPEKKDTVVCLAGARSLLRPGKKNPVVCLAGARFWRLRPEKKNFPTASKTLTHHHNCIVL